MNRARVAAGIFALVAAAATSCDTAPTYVLVVMDTDAPSRVQFVRAEASAGSVLNAGTTHSWAGQDVAFPASFSVTPGGGPADGQVTLQVSVTFAPLAQGQPAVMIQRTVRFRFVPHVASVVRMFLPVACGDTVAPPASCSDGSNPCTVSRYCELQTPVQTCGDNGRCTTVDVMPSVLPPDGAAFSDASDRIAPDVSLDAPDVSLDAPDVSDAPQLETATDAPRDVPCMRNCAGHNCGSDGCGGSCGMCSAGQVCSAGQCIVCMPGAPCSVANGCASGTYDCTGPTARCSISTMASAGSACTGGVCDGAGSCVPCVAGAACSTGNPCQNGSIACTTGAPVCHASTNVTAGTACAGGVCDGMAHCTACSSGASCITGNPCTSGSISCASGGPMCVSTNLPAGTTCPGGVCSGGGTCGACMMGAACTLNNGCTNGSVNCSGGTAMCNATGNVAAGTACAGGVCNGSGACVPCTAGATCSTGNPCTNGSIVCSSGAPVCTPSGNVAAGTACSGGVCNGSGTCVPCVQGMACTSASDCVATATIDCSTGAPRCTAQTYVAYGTACTTGVFDAAQCDGSGRCVCLPGSGCQRCGSCHFSCSGLCP